MVQDRGEQSWGMIAMKIHHAHRAHHQHDEQHTVILDGSHLQYLQHLQHLQHLQRHARRPPCSVRASNRGA